MKEDLFTLLGDLLRPAPDGYFNTVGERGKDLSTYRAKAEIQTEAILAAIAMRGKASPSQLAPAFPGVPLTSIRRAMTVLTQRGKLVKLDERVVGAYGRNEHVWAIAAA